MNHHENHENVSFGLWVYIMRDCILFACLFAGYAVLHTQTAGGPSGMELFDRPFVLAETLLLLASSFTCGLALLAARAKNSMGTALALASTFLLGMFFLGMEMSEFATLIAEGHGWGTSAFL